MKLTFNTNRPYSKEGQLIQAEVYNSYQRDGVDYLEVFFQDTTRKLGGVIELDCEFDSFSETNIMKYYDNNNFDDDRYTEVREFFKGETKWEWHLIKLRKHGFKRVT